MHFPVKLNADRVPTALRGILPSKCSPAPLVQFSKVPGNTETTMAWFSARVSSLQSAGTWKTTKPGRHPLTQQAIVRLAAGGGVRILDVGISDGATSLELIAQLGSRFASYYATDRTLRVRYEREGGVVRFYERNGDWICAATPWLVVYPPDEGTSVLHWWARRFERPIGGGGCEQGEVVLVQPELIRLAHMDSRVVVREHDVFNAWDGPAVNLVKVANVLNRIYFADSRIELALAQIHSALVDGGHLVITENRKAGREQATVFRRIKDRFDPEQVIGRGCDILDLVEAWRHGGKTE